MFGTTKAIIPLLTMVFISTASSFLIMPELGELLLSSHLANVTFPSIPFSAATWYYNVALSCPQIFMLFGAPVWGAIADHYGRRITLLYALGGILISMLITAGSITYHQLSCLYIGQALLGLTDASDTIAQAAIMDISQPNDKARNLGLINIASSLGLVMGPIAGGFLSTNKIFSGFGLAFPCCAASGIIFLNIIILKVFFKDNYLNGDNPPQTKLTKIIDFSFLRQSSLVKKLSLLFFLMQLSVALFYQTILLILWKNFHASPMTIGLYFSLIALAMVLTYLILLPWLANLMLNIYIVAIGFAGILVGASILLVFHSLLTLILIGILMATSFGLIYSIILNAFSTAVNATQQARVMGFTLAITSCAFICVNLIQILMLDKSCQAIFFTLVIFAVLGLLVTFICRGDKI